MTPKLREVHAVYAAGMKPVLYPPIASEHRLCDVCERGDHGHQATPQPTPFAEPGDLEAWQDFVSRWSIDYPVRARFSAYLDKTFDGNPIVRISMDTIEVPDSRDPMEMMNSNSQGLLVPSRRPDEESPRWIRALMLYHLTHELDEFLAFEGRRVFDPHGAPVHCASCTSSLELP